MHQFPRTTCGGILIKIKLSESFHRILIPEPYQFILLQHVLLRPHILTAYAVILFLILIIKHIDIQVSHKAGGTPVI